MFHQVPEKQMHFVRWLLVSGWLILIVSLFYDPISPYLTQPTTTWSIFRLDPKLLDPEQCKAVLTVQGKCLDLEPFPIGAEVFWGIVIPCAVMLLLVFGHETWRRICPLSFLSQIPRALGWQRQRKITNPRTGAVRYELAKVGKDSWLARNHLYVQFGLLCIGLCMRILFINSDRLFLGSFFIFTILSAIVVGYLFAGKSWCQYFCPMAPVQMVYNGPRALLGSQAHQGQRQTITQSMCRTVDQGGKEKSACVSCQSPCIDIDAERSYWDVLNKPGRRFVQYGYVGLVFGFYLYYFLYSGTLNYYYSGAWSHEKNHLGTLFSPGFYLFNQAIPIPKLVAVPLTIGACVVASYFLFSKLEKAYKAYRRRIHKPLSQQQVQHRIFTVCTFLVFNIYFLFGGRPILKKFPTLVELGFNALVIVVSTLWMYRTLARSAEAYSRESLADSLRRQLSKLKIDFSKFLEGRSMADLKPDEVYVLAKVLPSYSKESSLQVYKGMLREALEQGTVDPGNSLESLQQVRLELGLKDEEHFEILTELGVENSDLFDPSKRRSRENQLRIESYRQALKLQLLDLVEMGVPLRQALQRRDKQIQALKQEYGITAQEQAQILEQMTDDDSVILRKAESLLAQLKELAVRNQVLSNFVANPQAPVYVLLRTVAIAHKQHIVIRQLLGILEVLGNSPEAMKIARAIAVLAENALPDILHEVNGELPWQKRLTAEMLAVLQPDPLELAAVQPSTVRTMLDIKAAIPDDEAPTQLHIDEEPHLNAMSGNRLTCAIAILKELLHELEPLIQATALYALEQLDTREAREQARQILSSTRSGDWLVRETAANILEQGTNQATAQSLGTLDKLLLIFESSLLRSVKPESLIELARKAEIRIYPQGTRLCDAGELSDELLLLVDGEAYAMVLRGDSEVIINTIHEGETIGEMGVLTRQPRSANVVANAEKNRVLVIEAKDFERVLRNDSEVSRGLLLNVMNRLQGLTEKVKTQL